MQQNEKIQNALKLCEKLDQLESILWDRYWHEFLTLLEQENVGNPSIDDHHVDPMLIGHFKNISGAEMTISSGYN